jgi:hypothetical protein
MVISAGGGKWVDDVDKGELVFYDWLIGLPSTVRTKNFYQFFPNEGTPDFANLSPVASSIFSQWERIWLMCDGRNSPSLAIYAPRRFRVIRQKRQSVVSVGFANATSAFYRLENDVIASEEIYAGQMDWCKPTGKSIDQWLFDSHEKLKNRIGRKSWRLIVQGPQPFSDDEAKVVDARTHISWKVDGFTEEGFVRFWVENRSDLVLQCFMIGVEDIKKSKLSSAVPLPVKHILPGRAGIAIADCYSKQIRPEELRFFDLPTPTPETRLQYWELGTPWGEPYE